MLQPLSLTIKCHPCVSLPCVLVTALNAAEGVQRFACCRHRLSTCILTPFYFGVECQPSRTFFLSGWVVLSSFFFVDLSIVRRWFAVLRSFVSQHSDTHFTVQHCASLRYTAAHSFRIVARSSRWQLIRDF